MSTDLLKEYIAEVMMSQNIVRKDPEGTGQLIVRKLVTFKKPASRFSPGDDVDTELDPQGVVVVDDIEKWTPDYEKTRRKPRKVKKRTTRLA
jgi:hypothetical protein